MALSKLGKFMLERTRRIGQAWAVLSYDTDELMTPCSKYFSGASTLNGTPGGDRWARLLLWADSVSYTHLTLPTIYSV